MPDPNPPQYGYDPFSTSGKDRWGRKTDHGHPTPKIENYEIIDLVGAGGMGAVWSAKYIPLNQPRAVKVLNDALAIDLNTVARFAEEARALARLDHPYIVKVYDVSADPALPYMAMDFVSGETIADILKKRTLTEKETVKYLRQIAEALDYAHAQGFVHRDIKTSNVLISNAGNAMLIDFGIATWLGSDGGRQNTISGTTRYLSPEATRGERVTRSSDLWAFAVLMYRMLTGSMPFDGRGEAEIFKAIQFNPPKEPEHPKKWVRDYLRGLFVKDPKQRPKSAGEMVDGLEEALRPLVTKKGLEGIAVGTSFILVCVAVVIGAGAVAAFFMTRSHAPSPVAHKSKAKGGDIPAVTPITTSIPGADEIGGVWFGAFGNRWGEAHFTASSDGALHVDWVERGTGDKMKLSGDGTLGADNVVKFKDRPDGAGTDAPAYDAFTGRLSDDHLSIVGKLTTSDGAEAAGQFVRSAGLPTTLYQDSTLGFSIPLPVGWQNARENNGVSFAPIGRNDVSLTVSTIPGAQTVDNVINQQEQDFTAQANQGGTYRLIGKGAKALGGRQATGWEFEEAGPNEALRHHLVIGFVDGENCITVVSVWPAADEEIWPPVLDSMRSRMSFGAASSAAPSTPQN